MNAVQSLHKHLFIIMTPEAERFNGWAAMLGFVAAVGAYVTTGQIIQVGFKSQLTKLLSGVNNHN